MYLSNTLSSEISSDKNHNVEAPMKHPKDDGQVREMVARITRRASKACDSCRRQKTKCFPNSMDDTGSCLRCASVGRPCSFVAISSQTPTMENDQNSQTKVNNIIRPHKRRKISEENEKGEEEQEGIFEDQSRSTPTLQSIDQSIQHIIAMLYEQQVLQQSQNQAQSRPLNLSNQPIVGESLPGPLQIPTSRMSSSAILDESPNLIPRELTSESGFAPSTTSPFHIIQLSIPAQYYPPTIHQLLTQPKETSFEDPEPENIVSLGIISVDLLIQLVDKFKNNYEQWISLPRSLTTKELIYDLRFKCPILLTSICLTTLRFDYKKMFNDDLLIKQLIQRLKIELKENLTTYHESKNLEFLKALVILCVYGHSLSTNDLILDPWFLSGIAIQWFLTLDRDNTFLSLRDSNEASRYSLLHQLVIDENEEEKLSNFRIWNHICLVHLTNCIFSARQCLVDEIRLDQSRKNLELPLATNFDGRMIGEISLQLSLYNFIQTSSATGELNESFLNLEIELKQWYKQWSYLFEQPQNLQFLEFGYHYCYVVALYHFKLGGNISKDVENNDDEEEISDPSVLSKLLYHSLKVLDPILNINQTQRASIFSSLSDQIHLCLYYGCLVLLKTLKWIKKHDSREAYGAQELANLVNNVRVIKDLYESISRNDMDIAFKYSKGLELTIESLKL